MMIRRSAGAVLIGAAFAVAAAPMAWADDTSGVDSTVLDVVDNVLIEGWAPPGGPTGPGVPPTELPPPPPG